MNAVSNDACPLPSPSNQAAWAGVSLAFAALGRVFVCLDEHFRMLHASHTLDSLAGAGRAQRAAGQPVEELLGTDLFGASGPLRQALLGGERREGWRALLRLDGGETRLVSLTVAPFPRDPDGICDPRVSYVLVLRPADDDDDAHSGAPLAFHGLVARSEAMLRVVRLIQTLEPSEADIWDDERTFAQVTVARAFNVTDGFNGLVVLPNDPLTGQAVKAPIVFRFTPSTNLGDLDLASVVLLRRQAPLDAFVSFSANKSHPEPVSTPFGGFFSDPFESPTPRTGSMWYAGLRYRFNRDKTKVGAEFNHGSKYWLNFAVAEDDLIAPKTSTRGDVFEAYLTHRIHPKFIVKLGWIKYWYDYSLSGWQVGAPKPLDATPAPVLGMPAYDRASKLSLALTARF